MCALPISQSVLRLPKFRVIEPETLDEALNELAEHQDRARILAGGTDLLPNLKHEIESPEVLVSLRHLDVLRGVHEDSQSVRIGPLTTIHDLATSSIIARNFPSLAEACAEIAGPQLRRMGTIGGNVCLDTRCVYINQTYFWRQSLGFCLKKDGTVCHVVAGGRRCVAAASNDSGPVLLTLDAQLELASSEGRRTIAIDDFYVQDGIFNQTRRRDELLVAITIPKLPLEATTAYRKLRTRAAIDFPELGVAVRIDRKGDKAARIDIALTALASRPVRVPKLEAIYADKALDPTLIEALARAAEDRAKPLTNIATDPDYRKRMARVFVRRALEAALSR